MGSDRHGFGLLGQLLSKVACNDGRMMCRQKKYNVGDWVTVKHCPGGYRLPDGLPVKAEVRVLSKDCGYVLVEFAHERFQVAMSCVESGWEYYFRGKWYDEAAPVIIRMLHRRTRHHKQSAVR